QAGEVSRAEGRRLADDRPLDGDVEEVGLELEEVVVAGRAAVDADGPQTLPGVGLHRLDDVDDLVGDGLDGRPGDVTQPRAPGDSRERAAGVRVPVRRREAGEGGDDYHSTAVRDARGELRDGVRGRAGTE